MEIQYKLMLVSWESAWIDILILDINRKKKHFEQLQLLLENSIAIDIHFISYYFG